MTDAISISPFVVPLQAVPSQQLLTTLNNQTVQINVYQLRRGLFMDVLVGDPPVLEIGAVICQNLNRIIRNNYLNVQTGFSGDFMWYDTQGTSDPTFDGLGTRYLLFYLTADLLASLGFSDT